MSFPRLIDDLDRHIKSAEKQKQALQRLLLSGKISQNTLEAVQEKVSGVISIVSDLKETLEKEVLSWKANIPKETRILESFLVELRLKSILGELGEEEWIRQCKIITSGLDTLRNIGTLTNKAESEPASPIQTTLEGHPLNTFEPRLERRNGGESPPVPSRNRKDLTLVEEESNTDAKRSLTKHRRRIAKEPPALETSLASKAHCMNPWRPECKDTDIELSIYYKGRMTPICHKCWEEISKNNLEWSSL